MVKTLVLVRHGVSERGSEDIESRAYTVLARGLYLPLSSYFLVCWGPEGEEGLRFGQVLLFARLRLQIVAEALMQKVWKFMTPFTIKIPSQAELEHADAETLILVGHAPF